MKNFFGKIVLTCAAIAAGLSLVAPAAEAGFISATATGPATITGPASTSVTFAGSPGSPYLPGTFAATPFLESLTGTADVTLSFAYDGNRDGGPFNRLVLVKTNNTGTTLGGYEFAFSSVNSVVTAPLGVFIGTYNGATSPPTFTSNSPKLSAVGNTFTYSGLISNGETVAFYIPVSFASTGAGTFTMTQTVVPEPSSFALLGLGGLGLSFGAYRRRRAAAV
jgi:hypothetical protein